jgi:hypothetical protein
MDVPSRSRTAGRSGSPDRAGRLGNELVARRARVVGSVEPVEPPRPFYLGCPIRPRYASAHVADSICADWGGLYLLIIFVGIVGPLLTRERLVVSGNASATAENIAAALGLWRMGIALDVVMQLCDVPVWILFQLLRPVNRVVAGLALLLNIVQTGDARGEPADSRGGGAGVALTSPC